MVVGLQCRTHLDFDKRRTRILEKAKNDGQNFFILNEDQLWFRIQVLARVCNRRTSHHVYFVGFEETAINPTEAG